MTGPLVVLVRHALKQQREVHVVRRTEEKLRANRVDVERIPVLPARKAVLHVAVELVMQNGQARGQRVRHRAAYRAFRLDPAALAERELRVPVDLVRGFHGDVVNEAAGGITAVQRTLRPAQNFRALDVEHLRVEAHEVRLVELVHVDGRWALVGVREIAHRHATQRDVGEVALPGVLAHGQARCERGELQRTVDAELPEPVLPENRHADRHVLRGLQALLRGHDHFLDRLGGHDVTGRERRQHRCGGQSTFGDFHVLFPE
jgi:hypothetical protein